jgi:cytochrome oxidase assembly protein ShyY1
MIARPPAARPRRRPNYGGLVRFLLRPGWLGLTAAVVLFAVASFTLLAPWQFRRHDERQARNHAVEASFRHAPVPIEGLTADQEWRQVTLTGRYLPEAEAVARLRSVQGEPAFEVLTPFRLTSGTVVLVNRGYVRPQRGGPSGTGRGNQVPDYGAAPGGEVTVVGRLRHDEVDGQGRDAFNEGGHRQVYAIDSATIGEASGLTIRPGYVQLVANQPGVLGAMPLPRLDAGPHLAYALQWLAFGVMAAVGWLLLVRRELTERRVANGQPAAPRPPSPAGANPDGKHG